MELAAWGAIGEVVGAFAVVLSVVYLANQLKDSARTATVQAHQNQTQASQIILQMMVSQPECWRRGHAAPETLSPGELTRYHAMMYSYLLQLADLWHAGRNSAFDRDTLNAWVRVVAALLNTPGGASWWQEARPLFLPDLITTIEASRGSVPAWTTIHPRQFVDLGGSEAGLDASDGPDVGQERNDGCGPPLASEVQLRHPSELRVVSSHEGQLVAPRFGGVPQVAGADQQPRVSEVADGATRESSPTPLVEYPAP